MKKGYSINLGGVAFHINEDAYDLLDKYLNNLRAHFGKEKDGEEIVHDMELRISELFSDRLTSTNQYITLADVEEIITQMGKPEEFSKDIEADIDEPAPTEEETNASKRLFRNMDGKMIGGVCTGIATYFGWNVAVVRVLWLIFFLFFRFYGVLGYLIAWIIMPEARTEEERQAMGKGYGKWKDLSQKQKYLLIGLVVAALTAWVCIGTFKYRPRFEIYRSTYEQPVGNFQM